MKNLKQYYKKYWEREPVSILDLILYKMVCNVVCAGYLLSHIKKLVKTKKVLLERSKRNTREKRSVFVFANGPSLKDIDLAKVVELQNKGNYDVIAINSFLSKSGKKIKPDYAVFADGIHFQSNSRNTKINQYAEDIKYCVENNVTTLVPAEHYGSCSIGPKLAFCTISNIYSKNTKTICKPVGFPRLTAFYALVLAKELGYHRIYIAGFDNSYFKDFEVTGEGQSILRHVHYYDDHSTDTSVTPMINSTVAIFYNFYRHFYFIEKITKDDTKIINVAKVTYINTIPIDLSLDIYK